MSKKKTFALQLTALPVKDQEWLAYDFIFTFDTETKTTSVIFEKNTRVSGTYTWNAGILDISFSEENINESLKIMMTKSQYVRVFTQKLTVPVLFRSNRFYNKPLAANLVLISQVKEENTK